jgi:hypothetical protein
MVALVAISGIQESRMTSKRFHRGSFKNKFLKSQELQKKLLTINARVENSDLI